MYNQNQINVDFNYISHTRGASISCTHVVCVVSAETLKASTDHNSFLGVNCSSLQIQQIVLHSMDINNSIMDIFKHFRQLYSGYM